jgi:hypothetical protein
MNGLIKSPPEQPPLSSRNAYTTWPGGVDPTVPLFNTDNQKFGGARSRRGSRKVNRGRRNSRKVNRRNSRKVNRRNSRKVNRRKSRNNMRKVNRKSRRASRRSYRGGYASCSPIDTLGSRATIPMTNSVCPEGYFQDKGLIA